jgi:hypothetical protein
MKTSKNCLQELFGSNEKFKTCKKSLSYYKNQFEAYEVSILEQKKDIEKAKKDGNLKKVKQWEDELKNEVYPKIAICKKCIKELS